MKKTWVNPRIEVQQFVPNEYVAACYNVLCEIGQGNKPYAGDYDRQSGGWIWSGELGQYSGLDQYSADEKPHGSACGRNTVINDNGTIYESGKGSSGDIVQIVDNDGSKGLSAGDYVYWYTGDINNTGLYNHFGTAYSVSSSNPNMS